MLRKFKQPRSRYGIILLSGVFIIGIALGSFTFMHWPGDGGGGGGEPSGNAPYAYLSDFSIFDYYGVPYMEVRIDLSDSDSQIRSYFVSLLLNGGRHTFFEADVEDGPYGSSVSETIQHALGGFGVNIESTDETILLLEATDTQYNYASYSLAVSFSYQIPEPSSTTPTNPLDQLTSFDIFIPAFLTLFMLIYFRKRWRNNNV